MNYNVSVTHFPIRLNLAGALLLIALMSGTVVSCEDYEKSSGVSIRHFHVAYTINDNGTTAGVIARFRLRDGSGEEIELHDGDSVSVNGVTLSEDDEAEDLEYYASCASSDRYVLTFRKAGKTYTDVVDMPLELDSITVPATIQKNNPFTVDWGNYEAGSIIVLNFYYSGKSIYCSIPDDESTEFTGDNSPWLSDLTPGSVSMSAYRTRNYAVNRAFRDGEIVVRGPRTPVAAITLE